MFYVVEQQEQTLLAWKDAEKRLDVMMVQSDAADIGLVPQEAGESIGDRRFPADLVIERNQGLYRMTKRKDQTTFWVVLKDQLRAARIA